MTHVEQKKIIEELRGYVARMDRKEQYDFEMMLKRTRDDEELDTLTVRRLEELQKKYIVKKTKQDIEALLKKYSADLDKKDQSE
ncbi:MAG: hypothetical protein HY276_05655 [Ignavibacteriales bacterium]|nr:hypothetical protein [Ignavibacteriales bacterium]MBI3787728.1 hypothetical protein [Ignavibacteriales bacterium]